MPKNTGSAPRTRFTRYCAKIASSYTSGPNGHRPQKGLTEVKFECGDAACHSLGRRAVEQQGPAPLGRRLVRVGILVGFSLRRWNGRERGPPGRGPISLEK